MAEAILLTGKRGEGKSLSAIKMIERRLSQGRIVATNLNLNIDKLCPPWSKAIAYRLPDHPTAEDLEALPLGNPNPIDEKRNGLLVLDECAGFLNSREWQGKDRLNVISWLSQSRKYGWDLLLIAQDAKMIDTQIRNALCDLHGVVKRTDKIGIPFVTWSMMYFFGVEVRMPKLHVATFYYGFSPSAPKSSVDIFGGSDLYQCYDTIQKINPISGNQNLYTMLSSWHLKGRYMRKSQMYGRIAATMLLFGLFLGSAGGYIAGHLSKSGSVQAAESGISQQPPAADETVTVQGTIMDGSRISVLLSDGRVEETKNFVFDQSSKYYQVGNKWYRSAE